MKKFLLYILLLGSTSTFAQQITFESQYMLNQYLINPAAAGSKDNLPIGLSFRQQWAGFTDAPSTQTLNGQMKLKGKKVGLGALITNDETGPLRQTNMQLTYAYHLEINKKSKVSFGLSALLAHYSLDQSQFILDDEQDQLINGSKNKILVPDANFGVYYYTDDYYVGVAVPQLFQNKLKLGEMNLDENRHKRHYYFSGGYKYNINDDYQLEPSFLLKATSAAPVQFDVNAKVYYQQFIWAGVSYRNKESLVTMLGMNKGPFLIAYAYDWTLSNIRHYSAGTHELYLQYTLPIGEKNKASI